ncbi:MAG: hypothetical protein QOH55_986 [Microbacteriaceae bacterium]|jgi:hypothetical protein|nr:hypothetical protein [Microbacteriaceae bacterium]
MRVRRLVGGAVIALALVGALAACGLGPLFVGPAVPSKSEFVGVWRHTGPDGKQAVIELAKNQRVSVTGLPRDVLQLGNNGLDPLKKPNWADSVDTSGTWLIAHDSVDSSSYIELTLGPKPSSTVTKLFFDRPSSHLQLYFYLNDPDLNVTFRFQRE